MTCCGYENITDFHSISEDLVPDLQAHASKDRYKVISIDHKVVHGEHELFDGIQELHLRI
jgi:hypothetical protein